MAAIGVGLLTAVFSSPLWDAIAAAAGVLAVGLGLWLIQPSLMERRSRQSADVPLAAQAADLDEP